MKVTQSYTPGPGTPPDLKAQSNRWSPRSENPNRAMMFLAKYPWQRISEISETSLVVEETGRNTKAVWAWRFEGTLEEILSINQFLYLVVAIGAACYCSLGENYRESHAAKTAERLQRFPENARVPIPFACQCFGESEFAELVKSFTDAVPTATDLALLERLPRVFPSSDYELPATGWASSVAAMLVAGISAPEDIATGVRAAAKYPEPLELEDLQAAAELSAEGACSFQEILVL